jgi:hypothetical protein
MKQILLLAAIYSLVLHQSRKNEKARVFPVTPTVEIQKSSLAAGLFSHRAKLPAVASSGYVWTNSIVNYRINDKD